MKKRFAAPAAVSSALCAVALTLGGCTTPPRGLPVQADVDLSRYTGTWYEQARLPNTFQADCATDVMADYGLLPDGTLGITNQCRRSDGSTKIATAQGRVADSGEGRDPARLEVRFAPRWTSWLPMVWGDYWIIRLEDDYRYSLVGTPDRKYLWVLSRDRQADPAVVDELLQYAGTLGFPVEDVIRQ